MSDVFDAHHHLWDTRVVEYRLFRERVSELDRPFLLDEYEREARALGVTGSLWVEAASAGADGRRELDWVIGHVGTAGHVGAGGLVQGLVGWVRLEDADEAAFEALPAAVVGVRRSFEFEEPAFARRPEVARGARLAGERGLVVDLVLFPAALPAVIDLVDACPGTEFVLDHLGKPEIAARRWEPWASHLRELAQRPNVGAKLSGLATEADRAGWTPEDLRPYVEHALDAFGADRLLYGSDWPMVNLAGGHRRWVDAVLELLRPVEQSAILGENARRLYLSAA